MIQKSRLGEDLLMIASPNGKRCLDAAKSDESSRCRTVFSEENTASADKMQLLLRDDSSDEGVTSLLLVTRGVRGS
jgi:hypothetical protein